MQKQEYDFKTYDLTVRSPEVQGSTSTVVDRKDWGNSETNFNTNPVFGNVAIQNQRKARPQSSSNPMLFRKEKQKAESQTKVWLGVMQAQASKIPSD